MIKVVGFGSAYGLPSPSPFVLKLETWLRMAGIPYESNAGYSPFKAPKGKAPYVVLEDGSTVADSSLIIETLTRSKNLKLDDGLSEEQRARGVAIQRTLEDHLYFAVLYSRWIDPPGWSITRQQFFGKLPAPVRLAIGAFAQRGTRQNLHGHGLGRLSRDEIYEHGVADVRAFATLLGDREWLLDRPSSFDAIAYGFAANLVWVPFNDPVTRAAREAKNIERYAAGIRDRYWA